MGQWQSTEAAAEEEATITSSPPVGAEERGGATTAEDHLEVSPLEALIAEASSYSGDENASLEAKAQKALECPCVAELRSGPCGAQFTEAFLCFMKSTAEEKGSDCVHPFVALQECIKENPDAFSKDILEDEESNIVDDKVDYKIIPPLWAKETKSNL